MSSKNILGSAAVFLLLLVLGAPIAYAEQSPLSLIRPAKVYGVDIISETNAPCRVYLRIGLESDSPIPLRLHEGSFTFSFDFGGGEEILIGKVLIEDLFLPVTTADELIKARVQFEPEGDKSPQQTLNLIKMIVDQESSNVIICRGRGFCAVSLLEKKPLKLAYEFEVPIHPLNSLVEPGSRLLWVKGRRDD